MGIRLLSSIGVCLTAAGLAFADEPRPQSQPATPPVPQNSKPADDKSTPPLREPERLRTMPTHSAESPPPVTTVCDAQPKPRVTAADLRDDHIGPGSTMWADLEYLYWWSKDGPLPVPIAISSTGEVLGNAEFTYDDRPGGRLTVGTWLDVPHQLGIEASGVLIARNRVSATLSSDANGNPSILRPFINVLPGVEPAGPFPGSFLVSVPGALAGSITVTSQSRFWGAEANLVRNIVSNSDAELDLMLGFRYLDLDENLNVDQRSTIIGAVVPFNAFGKELTDGVLTLTDQFATRNNLLLGQVGGRASLIRGPLTADFLCKVGFGPNLEQVRIAGTTQFAGTQRFPNGGGTAPFNQASEGGLLALSGTNIGRTRTSWFSIVPEVGAQLGWNLTSCVKFHVGYSFLYLNSVVRPGDQISQRINPGFIPASNLFGSVSAPAEPAALFRQTDYWIHGITAGVMLRY